ncbi:MAG TPA: helix-turn-helix transcriptional regulator [Terriglobia bacterium]|nr:helix-turn-helix transcriptional regulator [Terriglobia bacterium]
MSQRRHPNTLIGQRLRELRKQKGLLQRDVQTASGLQRGYVSRVERGHTIPSLETLEKFARVLEVPLFRLFYSGDAPAPTPHLTPRMTLEEVSADSPEEARFFARLKRLMHQVADSDREVLLGLAKRLAEREGEAGRAAPGGPQPIPQAKTAN